MTQNDVQRGIKNARDILVGKVPDPMTQVKQITLALMYKFIDDMDQAAEEIDGKATFFTGDFKKYAWHSLMDVKIGNQERMNLYAESLEKLPFNEKLPPLFREIFKDAFLPYRDPNTLSLFLKEINNFSYDNSENLGSAFEHLLSIMSSQGDAGQFRTPRHIIDFIVAAVDPAKTDTVLDPACGTAGFLISAYKHILKTNENKLSPDERKRISDSFAGYDISPDMIRLSLVNLYLHGFKQPKIVEYDTLGSDSKWNEFYDVILANPPFMSPRGGIKPHKRFEVQANRSEVLFVDYIMEHLTPNGRAGVIVPEGIIFQSANAYKALRKMLVDNNYLYAVVSLPAGVFNPYSGVKTSILLMDRVLARKTKGILFVKIQNDGFDLGAQRRSIEKNDLIQALQLIKEFQKNPEEEINFDLAHVVSKTKIAGSGNYNLSSNHYHVTMDYTNAKWPMVKLGDLAKFVRGPFGGSLKKEIFKPIGYLIYEQYHAINNDFSFARYFIDKKKFKEMKRFEVSKGDLLVSCSGTMGKVAIVPKDHLPGIINQALLKLTPNNFLAKTEYLKIMLESDSIQNKYFKNQSGVAIQNVASVKVLSEIKIPLPSLKIQKQIVTELESIEDEIKFNEKETEALKKLQNRIVSDIWRKSTKNTQTISFMDKCEINTELRSIWELLNYMQNNQNSSVFIYFFENTILSLREVSYLIEKYFSDKLDQIIKDKIRIITKARNAICHRSSPLNYISVENQIKFTRNIVKGKCNLMKVENVEIKSEFEDDIAVFYGNTGVYLMRDIKCLYESFIKLISKM
jgi:type I restriction enzyme M protein